MNIVMEDFRVKEISMERIRNWVHLKPGIRLKSSAFIESVMPEIYRATDRVRTPKKTAAEMDRTIVSCIIGNLVAGGETPVIIKLSNNQKYPGLSQKQLKRIIETLDALGWISLTKGVWRGDAGMITKRNLDLGGLEISRATEDEIVVRKKGYKSRRQSVPLNRLCAAL